MAAVMVKSTPKINLGEYGRCFVREISVKSWGVYDNGDRMVDIHLQADDPRVANLFINNMGNPLTGLIERNNEFVCIWCGSVNPISHRHCSQCGGPRGALLNGA